MNLRSKVCYQWGACFGLRRPTEVASIITTLLELWKFCEALVGQRACVIKIFLFGNVSAASIGILYDAVCKNVFVAMFFLSLFVFFPPPWQCIFRPVLIGVWEEWKWQGTTINQGLKAKSYKVKDCYFWWIPTLLGFGMNLDMFHSLTPLNALKPCSSIGAEFLPSNGYKPHHCGFFDWTNICLSSLIWNFSTNPIENSFMASRSFFCYLLWM